MPSEVSEKDLELIGVLPENLENTENPEKGAIIGQASSQSINKCLEEFGNPENHKPTVLISLESARDIETSLVSYFASAAEQVNVSKLKYKVIICYDVVSDCCSCKLDKSRIQGEG